MLVRGRGPAILSMHLSWIAIHANPSLVEFNEPRNLGGLTAYVSVVPNLRDYNRQCAVTRKSTKHGIPPLRMESFPCPNVIGKLVEKARSKVDV